MRYNVVGFNEIDKKFIETHEKILVIVNLLKSQMILEIFYEEIKIREY